MTHRGNWNYPTSIRFGAGRIAELPNACRELGMNNPLFVTDPNLLQLEITKDTLNILDVAEISYSVFSDIQSNPVGSDVERGVRLCREGAHDGVIAFGGGAALDVAKAIALMKGQTHPLFDFEDIGDYWTRVDVSGMIPCVAVPTTSGTGSEVGRASVIIHEEEVRKAIIFHPNMLPQKVIADPALTIGLPSNITAAVGMDALSHNLEAFCAPGFHPQAEGIALQGMKLIHNSLLTAVEQGDNIEARADLMAASLMGATAFQKGLGAMHAMSHPLGAHLKVHHGLSNAIVMPYVLDCNRSAIDEKMEVLASFLNLEGQGCDAVIQWVCSLRSQLKIPHTLKDIGFEEYHCSLLAPLAIKDPSAGGNPIALTCQQYEELFRKAWSGDLL